MKRFFILFFLALIIHFGFAACTGDSSGDGGTTLIPEIVETPVPGDEDINEGGSSDEEAATEDPEIPVHNLFSTNPGTMVSMSSLTGTIDPVGTNITDDFDGDGLTNDKETTGNVWVADYPDVETSIATPVTMRIEILVDSETNTKTISSEITSEDTESTREKSTDRVHRNDVNRRTVQYQNSYNSSNAQDLSISGTRMDGYKKSHIRANISTAGIGSVDTKGMTKLSASYTNSSGKTITKWKTVPFKNHVRADGWTKKSNASSKTAKQFRTEYRAVNDVTKKIKPNAGYVRAALYISNNTVNMPVKISNVLCSLMLENNEGTLLPVQSFRLRNDDYSMFELNLYGATTFGPYVIELTGLNTQEIKDAITKGYSPRIYLVDYEMTHVPDSNYRTALSGTFSGNNLKIIEENAKGRTAGIKLVYPGDRQFFRVTAFDTDGVESRTGSAGATAFSPGVSLEKALTRLTYSGIDIQYADVIFDTSGVEPEMEIPRFHVRVVKSINGVEMNLPFPVVDSIPYKTVTGNHVDENGASLGGSSTAYLMKPISEWTDQEMQDFRIWAVFENGRYYLHTKDVLSTGGIPTYFEYTVGTNTYRIPMVEGIQSTIWPGDHYDITCLDYQEQEEEAQSFGNNPLETGELLSFNTKWNLNTIEEYPFQPDAGSAYLGEAILGDTIEFTIKLNQTRYLNPDFGTPDEVSVPGKRIYQAFSYDLDRPVATKKFEIDEAVDFEISFGLGGQYSHWTNLVDPMLRSPSAIHPLDTTDRNWNYLDQEFTIRIPIPMNLDGVGPDGTVKVFIRPARNNAYRESVWPLPYTEVKQFRGKLLTAAATGATQIEVADAVGTAYDNDTLYLDGYGYQISAVESQPDKTIITLATPLQSDVSSAEKAYVNLETPLSEPEIQIALDQTFESDWNMLNQDATTDNGDAYKPLTLFDQDPDSPANYLGYTNRLMETNWLGYQNYANPYWNQWADSANLDKLTQKGTEGSQVNNPDNPLNLKNELLGSAIALGASEETGDRDETWPQMAKYDDKLLTTWSSLNSGIWSIKGKILSLTPGKEGELIKEFDVTSDVGESSYSDIQVFDNNQKALVVWNNMSHVKGQIIDLTPGNEGQKIGPVIVVSDVNKGAMAWYLILDLKIVLSNEKVLVFWSTRNPDYDLLGQLVNLSSSSMGELEGSTFQIPQNTASKQLYPDLKQIGDKVLITWGSSHISTNYYDIFGRFIDMSDSNTGNFLTDEFAMCTSVSEKQFVPHIAIVGKKALIVWYSDHNGTDYDVMGQFISTDNGSEGSYIGPEFRINSMTTGDQYKTNIYVDQNMALVAWHSNYTGANQWSIQGRLLDLVDGNEGEMFGNEVSLSDIAYGNFYPVLSGVGNKVMLTWNSAVDADPVHTKKAKLLEMDPLSKTITQGEEIVLDYINNVNDWNEELIVTDQSAITAWERAGVDVEPTIQFFNWRINERNLFKAPLLERDYEVKARIVEE